MSSLRKCRRTEFYTGVYKSHREFFVLIYCRVVDGLKRYCDAQPARSPAKIFHVSRYKFIK